MIQVCDPPRQRPVRRFSAEEFCFLSRGEAGSLYRPRSEVLRMLTVGEVCGVCDGQGVPSGAVLLQPLNADTALAAALRAWVLECTAQADALLPLYIRQGFALQALRPLSGLAPCFVLAADGAPKTAEPLWVPLEDRAQLAFLLARGYTARDSRPEPQGTVLAMYPG